MTTQPQLELELTLDGPLVDGHRLPLSELQRVSRLLRAALRGVALVLTDEGPSMRTGRARRFIEQATDLEVVAGPRAGSFGLVFETPREAAPEQQSLPAASAPGLAEHALEALVAGLAALDEDADTLPAGFDRGVLKAVGEFRTALANGITTVSLRTVRAGANARFAVIDGARVELAGRLMKRPIRAHAVAEGTLEMVDRARLECRIDRPPKPSVQCTFDEHDRQAVQDAAWKYVRVSGEGEYPPEADEPRRIHVQRLDVLYESMPFDPEIFWQRRSIDDLAGEQNTAAFSSPADLDEDEWRDDDEADALIAAIADSA